MHGTDGSTRDALTGRGQSLRKTILRGNRNVIDLGQVMVVGSEPEYRHGVNSSAARLFGQLHCGQGLIDGEGRSTEEAYLLPRQNRCRTTPQALDIL